MPREADVREGDLIVTSGLGDRFPGGYPVARVSVINREEGLTFAQVAAQPLAALDRGREVLLISTRAPEPMAEPVEEEIPPGEQGDEAQASDDSVSGEAPPQ